MGLLSDFAGNFFTAAGNEMQRNDDLRLQMAIEARREKMRQDREARQRQMGMEDAVTMKNLDAEPRVGYDATGKPGLLRDSYAMTDGKPTRTTQRLGDAPVTVTRYGTQTTAAGKVSGKYMSDGSFVPDGAPLPPRAAGGNSAPIGEDGLTPYQREQLKLQRERESRLSEQGTRGRETKRNPRKDYMEESKFIAGADANSLVTYLKSIGVDPPDRTSPDVLNAPVTNEEDHYAGVLRRLAATEAEKRLGSDAAKPGKSPDKPKVSYSEAAAEVARRRPDLSPEDIKEYLARKGIRP